jgi:hypothetical protein
MKRKRSEGESAPMTLGGALAAKVRLIVWCKSCGHRAEPVFGRRWDQTWLTRLARILLSVRATETGVYILRPRHNFSTLFGHGSDADPPVPQREQPAFAVA